MPKSIAMIVTAMLGLLASLFVGATIQSLHQFFPRCEVVAPYQFACLKEAKK